VPDKSDSLRMLVIVERRISNFKGFVEKFSWYRIKQGSLGDSLKDNLFN